ncbi:MAG: sulfotransferase [Phycisphaerales bacterium]
MTVTDPIFITGRFRCGSTMLFNLFAKTPGCCAYYEPCHDGLPVNIRYTRPMASHRGIVDYWTAYRAILDDVDRLHDPAFGITRLVLEADDDWPDLRSWIELLIDRASPDRPVLQFNRVALRLPWLRASFPDATIIHLSRNPRDSYASMLAHLPESERSADDPAWWNVYEQREWSLSLAREFPFLAAATSMYARIYSLDRLSQLMAAQHAHHCLVFERDFVESQLGVDALIHADLLPEAARSIAADVIQPQPSACAPQDLHEDAWYVHIEAEVDGQLRALELEANFGGRPLAEIQSSPEVRSAWSSQPRVPDQKIIDTLLCGYAEQRSEITRLLRVVRDLEAASRSNPSSASVRE